MCIRDRIKEADARTVGLARDTALLLGLLIGEYELCIRDRTCARQASNEIVITYPFYNRIYTIPVFIILLSGPS